MNTLLWLAIACFVLVVPGWFMPGKFKFGRRVFYWRRFLIVSFFASALILLLIAYMLSDEPGDFLPH
jgi:hypothetical protein